MATTEAKTVVAAMETLMEKLGPSDGEGKRRGSSGNSSRSYGDGGSNNVVVVVAAVAAVAAV